jgi:hypothetical protein
MDSTGVVIGWICLDIFQESQPECSVGAGDHRSLLSSRPFAAAVAALGLLRMRNVEFIAKNPKIEFELFCCISAMEQKKLNSSDRSMGSESEDGTLSPAS